MRIAFYIFVFFIFLGSRGAFSAQQTQGLDMASHGKMAVTGSPIKNPVKADKKSVERGRKSYLLYCSLCHGDKGLGDGPQGIHLQIKPSNIADLKKDRTDYQLFLQMSLGGMGMPQQRSSLTENDRWDIVNFIRTLP